MNEREQRKEYMLFNFIYMKFCSERNYKSGFFLSEVVVDLEGI